MDALVQNTTWYHLHQDPVMSGSTFWRDNDMWKTSALSKRKIISWKTCLFKLSAFEKVYALRYTLRNWATLRQHAFLLVLEFYAPAGKYSWQEQQMQFENIGAKLLSARPAKVLNLLTTTLTTFLCSASEHVAKSAEIRWRTTMR